MLPWGEALPRREDLEDTPADLFLFYAVYDEVQHRGNQQGDVGQRDVNKTGSMFAETGNHGQANHGDVQDRIFKALRCSLWDEMLRIVLQVIIYGRTTDLVPLQR